MNTHLRAPSKVIFEVADIGSHSSPVRLSIDSGLYRVHDWPHTYTRLVIDKYIIALFIHSTTSHRGAALAEIPPKTLQV